MVSDQRLALMEDRVVGSNFGADRLRYTLPEAFSCGTLRMFSSTSELSSRAPVFQGVRKATIRWESSAMERHRSSK